MFTVFSAPTAQRTFRTHYLTCEKLPLEIKEINQEVKHWLKTSLANIGERSRLKSHRKLNQLFLCCGAGGIWFGAQGPDLRGVCGGTVGFGGLEPALREIAVSVSYSWEKPMMQPLNHWDLTPLDVCAQGRAASVCLQPHNCGIFQHPVAKICTPTSRWIKCCVVGGSLVSPCSCCHKCWANRKGHFSTDKGLLLSTAPRTRDVAGICSELLWGVVVRRRAFPDDWWICTIHFCVCVLFTPELRSSQHQLLTNLCQNVNDTEPSSSKGGETKRKTSCPPTWSSLPLVTTHH